MKASLRAKFMRGAAARLRASAHNVKGGVVPCDDAGARALAVLLGDCGSIADVLEEHAAWAEEVGELVAPEPQYDEPITLDDNAPYMPDLDAACLGFVAKLR